MRLRKSNRPLARIWRAVAAGHRANGNLELARQAARTAATLEGRPWKRDRQQCTRPAPQHSCTCCGGWHS